MKFEDVVNLVKKPVKKAAKPVKKAAKPVKKATKAPAKPRKTAAQRRAEEMDWYTAETSYDVFYKEIYDLAYEDARDHADHKGCRVDDYLGMYANEKEISEDSKSVALHEWLQCKSAEEIQAAIDSTAVPMPASIKKQAKERIKVLQEEAARGIERARPMMKQDVREQRRAELSEALRQRHPDIQIRSDSKMCDSYLKLNRRDDVKLDQVTNIMHEMWFLFNHTGYNVLQSQRCNAAIHKRDMKRENMRMIGLGRDYEDGWIDFNDIRERAKREAITNYIASVGRDNLPDFFPPTMRSWGRQ